MSDPDVIVNLAEVALLTREPWVREELLRRGVKVRAIAQADAPKRTGAGAASIVAEAQMVAAEGWVCDIGWDRSHDYMRYTDLGTKYIAAQHYLERALDQGV